MPTVKVGFMGFGEVASVFSKPIREKGAQVAAYDVLLNQDRGREILRRRIRTGGIHFGPLPDVIGNADYVLSTVTAQAARQAARECAAYLEPGQIYVDLNSMTPLLKAEVGEIIQSSGADFVEGAILGAVGTTGARTHILVGGKRGRQVADTLSRLGLHVSYCGPEIGKASMFKMLRSIFSKGLEALILELLIAGKRAGMEETLWKDIVEFMTRNPFDRVASNWVQTHAVAYERRYYEVVQVAETMRELGVEPVMTSGTEAVFKRSLSLGLEEAFPVKPDSMAAVIDFMEKCLRENAMSRG